MRLSMTAELFAALLLLKGLTAYWATTRHDPKGSGCSLEKYEGGDGKVNICKTIFAFLDYNSIWLNQNHINNH